MQLFDEKETLQDEIGPESSSDGKLGRLCVQDVKEEVVKHPMGRRSCQRYPDQFHRLAFRSIHVPITISRPSQCGIPTFGVDSFQKLTWGS